jgi:hypothetical protein
MVIRVYTYPVSSMSPPIWIKPAPPLWRAFFRAARRGLQKMSDLGKPTLAQSDLDILNLIYLSLDILHLIYVMSDGSEKKGA